MEDRGVAGGRSLAALRAATTISQLPWTAQIERELTVPESADCIEYLAREVQSGLSQLWECSDGEDTLRVITRVDQNPRELVICLVVGTGVEKFGPLFIAAARSKGLPMRMHTMSAAMARLCKRLGFVMAEYVLRLANS
jgi:hypothetical protein